METRKPVRLAVRDLLAKLQDQGKVTSWREARIDKGPAFVIEPLGHAEDRVPLRCVRAYLDGLLTEGAPAPITWAEEGPTLEQALRAGLVMAAPQEEEWLALALPTGEVYRLHTNAVAWFLRGLAARSA